MAGCTPLGLPAAALGRTIPPVLSSRGIDTRAAISPLPIDRLDSTIPGVTVPLFRRSFALLAFGLIALALVVASPARALGLTGQSMSVAYYAPDTSTVYGGAAFTPPSFVVGPGQETDGNVEDVTHLLVDFGDDTLDIVLKTTLFQPHWPDAAFSGMIFTSVLPHAIASATVDASTTMAGFNDSRVSFTGNQLLVNWADLSYVDGTTVKINFTFVPEPGGALLVGCGLIGLVFAQRKRA